MRVVQGRRKEKKARELQEALTEAGGDKDNLPRSNS